MTRHYPDSLGIYWGPQVLTHFRLLRTLPPPPPQVLSGSPQQSPLADLPGILIFTYVSPESVGGGHRSSARSGAWNRAGKGQCGCEGLPARSWSLSPHSLRLHPARCITKLCPSSGLLPCVLSTPFSLSSVSWPMGRARTIAGWKEETPRKGPQHSQRTFRRASPKMPDLHFALGFAQWHPRCFSSPRVELGCTQGRCLEPVGQDFWEEFQAGESWIPADWLPLSVRGGTLPSRERASVPP